MKLHCSKIMHLFSQQEAQDIINASNEEIREGKEKHYALLNSCSAMIDVYDKCRAFGKKVAERNARKEVEKRS